MTLILSLTPFFCLKIFLFHFSQNFFKSDICMTWVFFKGFLYRIFSHALFSFGLGLCRWCGDRDCREHCRSLTAGDCQRFCQYFLILQISLPQFESNKFLLGSVGSASSQHVESISKWFQVSTIYLYFWFFGEHIL